MFKTYDLKIKKLLADKPEGANWKKVLAHHKLMVARIQHERLIHLIVTVFVGIVLMSSFFVTLLSTLPWLLLLDSILTILFLAYIFHYRFLENTTQNWYKLEDGILNLLQED
jgi:hypothetical protein